MNASKFAVRLALATLVFGFVSRADAQDGPPTPKPGPEHKLLAGEEGTWDAVVKFYGQGPDAEPTVSKGTEVNQVVCDGLWMISSFKGDVGGMKFEGRGQFGYDPEKKKYVGSWIDSMSHALNVLEGTYDPKTKTLTYEGTVVDPGSKTKFVQKMATTIKDDGSRVFVLSMKGTTEGSPEMKMMEITYTKRK